MLIARGDLENYCSSCKNDEFVKILAIWLNAEIN
jgi:hypothetical protein